MPSAWPDNLHSRLVFWLKILLPLTALVILSTVFLLSRDIRPEDAIPYAKVDVDDLIRTPRLTTPDFAGVTADGAALSLKASEARLAADGSTTPGTITDLTGLLETPDGVRTDLSAHTARLDNQTRRMILEGGVTLSNSAGYEVRTEGLSVALDRTSLDTTGPVTATGPAFSLSAGRLELVLADPATPTYLLVFKQGVRMLYQPGTSQAKN